jgi:AraC-like DNA-binding protein
VTLADLAADLFTGGRRRLVEFGTAPLHDAAALCSRLISLHTLIETNVDDPLARQQAFVEAMAAVLVRFAEPRCTPHDARPAPRAIARAIEYANARLHDPTLSATELAAAACLSTYHFMRCFRVTTGVTVHGFVVQRRIEAARDMLAKGIPAAEVARAVGFTDQSHLIRRFRSVLGVTPGQYARDTRIRKSGRDARQHGRQGHQ